MTAGNIIQQKSFAFAARIVRLSRFLLKEKNETVLSRQILRSGTSIGANVSEAIRGQSRADFASKMNIALKEASETSYWLRLLRAGDYLTERQFDSLFCDCEEVEKILASIVKTLKPVNS